MNTKLLAGISLAAMAGSFWACGDGPINGKDSSDVIVESMFASPEELQSLKEQAEDDCKTNDPSCALMYGEYLNRGANPTPSSVTAPTSSASGPIQPLPGESSSSEEVINNHGRSSSSIVFVSSSAGAESSSSETVPATGLGSCKPTKNPINKGEGTTWSFSRNSSNGIAASKYQGNATYQWEFVGGSIPGDDTKFTSTEVTYMNSGEVTAAVSVTLTDGSSEKITCAPLQVNGDPITCTCTAEGGDVTADAGVATWTAKCTSKSAINNYSWDGVDGESTTFTHTFAKKGETYTPTLKVSNIDKTVETVPCMEIKATDTSVPEAYSCSVDKTEIELGQSFTFSVELSSGLSGHNCSIQGSGAPQNIQCSEASITVTPAEAGVQVYDYSLKGQKNNETVEESCSKKVSVVDNSATWESKTITLEYGDEESLTSGYIYTITYTRKDGQPGQLVCTGSGSVQCGSTSKVLSTTQEQSMGTASACKDVKVFGTASCKHQW